MLEHPRPLDLSRTPPWKVGRPMFRHLPAADLLQNIPQLFSVLQRLPRHLRVEAQLVELVRPENLDVHLHTLQGLLEGAQKVLGVGLVATFGVRDAREAVADVALEVRGDAGGYLAQGIYRVRVEEETHLFATSS